MHATLAKFGYGPGTVFEDAHWAAVVRAAQPTLGSLVLICKREVTAFADLNMEEAAALPAMASRIAAAHRLADPAQVNYLMLMMVDRHVHFHVIPRYEGTRDWGGLSFPDAGWPGVPDLAANVALDADQVARLVRDLRKGTTTG